jgi:hypothetical protein
MKSFVQFTAARWHLLVVLLLASLGIAACSPTNTPEDTQSLFEGVPVVRIAAPQPNDTYYEDVGVNIIIRVENAGPDIARVAITLDGQIIGEATLPNSGGAPSFVVTNSWTATGVGSHTIGAVVSRNDGTANTPVEVPINVVEALASNADSEPTSNTTAPTQAPTTSSGDSQSVQPQTTTAPTNTVAPTTPPEPTTPSEPTSVPPTATSSRPQVRVTTGANIRSGPGTAFEPPIGSLAAGAMQDLLAVHTSGQWYKIRYYNGEGWIFANTVEVVGDISSLPREAGPPTPIPVTPTPVATATLAAVADLQIGGWTTNPFPLTCGVNAANSVTIVNRGSGNSTATRVRIQDLFSGNVTTTANADIRALAPGESLTVTINITVTSNHSQGHVLRLALDPDGTLPETNEGNNQQDVPYAPLAQGTCP